MVLYWKKWLNTFFLVSWGKAFLVRMNELVGGRERVNTVWVMTESGKWNLDFKIGRVWNEGTMLQGKDKILSTRFLIVWINRVDFLFSYRNIIECIWAVNSFLKMVMFYDCFSMESVRVNWKALNREAIAINQKPRNDSTTLSLNRNLFQIFYSNLVNPFLLFNQCWFKLHSSNFNNLTSCMIDRFEVYIHWLCWKLYSIPFSVQKLSVAFSSSNWFFF